MSYFDPPPFEECSITNTSEEDTVVPHEAFIMKELPNLDIIYLLHSNMATNYQR